jgi:putative mRNA 3-end processing factor
LTRGAGALGVPAASSSSPEPESVAGARHAQLRGARRRGSYDKGFVLSDHADWPGLIAASAATGAKRVIVTHGSIPVMVRYLTEKGLQAASFQTEYGDDAAEEKLAA